MDFYVYDTDLQIVGIIDNYTSVIWTLRYNDAGDFEIYAQSTPELLEMCKINHYIARNSDNTMMIIKSVTQAESSENGDYITISGVSAVNLLSQRIVWNKTMLQGRVEECARTLVDVNCINPADPARIIPRLELSPVNRLTAEIALTDFTHENVFDAVKLLCDVGGYGFRIIFDGDNFTFEVYAGVDHTQNQNENVHIVFDADTLAETTYTNDGNGFKNVAYIGGSGEELARKYAQYGNAEGVNRFETFVDAGDITDTELLQANGRDALHENQIVKTFDGEMSNFYAFDVNYKLGDIVQIVNKHGTTATARITEIIQSIDDSGIYTIPTFSEWGLI